MIMMLQQERHNQIIAKLDLEGQVRVRDLSKDFNVTEDCIRKDLTILEKNGKLKRIHGGATQIRTNLHRVNVGERINLLDLFALPKRIAKNSYSRTEYVLVMPVKLINLAANMTMYSIKINIWSINYLFDCF